MPLPIFDTLDAIPESFRGEYTEGEDKKWYPKAETELATEKRKRAELLNEKKEEKRLREAAEQRAADVAREAEARANGATEEQLKKIRDAEALARKPIEEERDRLVQENRKLKLTDRVQALYLEHGGMADRVDDAMRVLALRSTLGDEGGIIFLDKDGKITADDPKSFFAKLKAEKPWFFTGTGGNGGGSGGSDGNGGVPDVEVQQRTNARHAQTARGAF